MEYRNLSKILNRYSFEEKMNIMQKYSRDIMSVNGFDVTKRQDIPMPWELETFSFFAINNSEYNSKSFKGKGINEFIKMINTIKSYNHKELKNNKEKNYFLIKLFSCLALSQFEIQEFYLYKYFRYYFIFNHISLKDRFSSKFGYIYDEFLEFGFLCNVAFSFDKSNINDILDYLFRKYNNIVSQLSISRNKYKELINRFSNNIDDYMYCVRPIHSYPIIIEKKLYIPLPHCLLKATSSSLLYRLTENNNKLREILGKDVLEDYLYKIINDSNVYDEVIKEKDYIFKKQNRKTTDLMIRKDDDYLFIDSKSLVPKSNIRLMDEESISNEINIHVKNVIQIYNHLRKRYFKEYNFFKIKQSMYNNDKLWGLIVVLEDDYIKRDEIYLRVSDELKTIKDSNEYIWLINHIKIVSLYEIEKFTFSKKDIIYPLKEQLKSNRPYDFSLNNVDKNKILYKDILLFRKKLQNILQNLAIELLNNNIIKKK